MAYTPNHPPFNLFFFRQVSAGFRRVPPGSAGFRRVPPGSSSGFRRVSPGSAGFRRVPLGSAAPLGSARFRWVPGFRQVSSAGLCRVLPFRQQGSCYRLPLQFIARIVPGSCQASVKFAAIKEAFLQVPGHCPSRLMEKITNKIAFLVE